MILRGVMDQKRKESYVKSMQEYSKLMEDINRTSLEIQEIENEISQYRFSYLIAKDTIYPGVSITILKYSKHINDFLGPSRIFLKGREIVIEEG